MPNLPDPVPNEEMVLLRLEAADHAQAMPHPPGTLCLRNLLLMTRDLEGMSDLHLVQENKQYAQANTSDSMRSGADLTCHFWLVPCGIGLYLQSTVVC